MGNSTWKSFERRLAGHLGTRRIPAAAQFGGQQKDQPDCMTARIAVQAKKGYSFPGYLTEWLEGIRRTAGDRIGVVVWGAKRVPDLDCLVCMRFGDFLTLLRFAGELPECSTQKETDGGTHSDQ